MNIDWFSFAAGAGATFVMLFIVAICLEISERLKRRRTEAEAEVTETIGPRIELIDIRDLEGSELRGT
jgi:hypothetical protein